MASETKSNPENFKCTYDCAQLSVHNTRDVVSVLNVSVSRRFLERLGLVSVLKVEHLGLVSVLRVQRLGLVSVLRVQRLGLVSVLKI